MQKSCQYIVGITAVYITFKGEMWSWHRETAIIIDQKYNKIKEEKEK